MNSGRTVFSQLIDFLPAHQFSNCVARYSSEFRVRISQVLTSDDLKNEIEASNQLKLFNF